MLPSEDFLAVYHRAVARAGEAQWPILSIHDQSDAIYREFRKFDAEQFAKRSDVITDGQAGKDTQRAA